MYPTVTGLIIGAWLVALLVWVLRIYLHSLGPRRRRR